MPLFACCSKKIPEVRCLDYRHSGLKQVPNAVFQNERTIESLQLDSNQIKSLPKVLFHCHGLSYLSISDNDITSIPDAVSNLTNLVHLDLSKNGIKEISDNIKCLKYLSTLNISVNPLGRLPEGFTQLLNITQLCLNDCFLEYLPGNFGRLAKLKILELRENHLKTLPQSVSRLSVLERLDIGCNEFTELPDVVGSLSSLLELWCDANQITSIPKDIGALKQIMYFDACKNRIAELPDEIDGCISLSDLHLSTNLLKNLPESIGRLSSMTTLKINDNQLLSLPSSIGGLVSLSELDVSANDLEEIPPTIGLLRHLRTLIADENFLSDIPCELGSCSALTVLSVRSNKLTYLPDEIGRIPKLRVLNLSDNEIKVLPFSLMNLKELQALWLAENQSKALIRLQSEIDPDTQRRCLTCYLLPQQRMDPIEQQYDKEADSQSFHASLWEEVRQKKTQIHFDESNTAHHEEHKSHYPKEMRVGSRHVMNESMRKTTSLDQGRDERVMVGSDEMLIESDQSSPCLQTHRLVKKEKEKQAKDLLRINRGESLDTTDIHIEESRQLLNNERKPHLEENRLLNNERKHHIEESRQLLRNERKHHKDRKNYDTVQTETPKPIMNGSLRNLPTPTDSHKPVGLLTAEQPKTIQNGHYNAGARPERRPSFGSQQILRNSNGNLTRIETPRESYSHVQRSHSSVSREQKMNGGIQLTSNNSNSNVDLSNSQTRLQDQQEDHCGVFTSTADPAMFQRRFKYYQRMRKHRNNPEVQSDLGYYGNQYKPGPASDAMSTRSHRRPLLQGRDGREKWERFSQRSMGDGHASDADGTNKRLQLSIGASPSSQRHRTSSSKLNLNDKHRPAVPPPYSAAVAHRTDKIENSPFPAPPPYKPPTRDPGPDGASNDGVPRTSPTQELSEKVPFTSYTAEPGKSPFIGRSPYVNRAQTERPTSADHRTSGEPHQTMNRVTDGSVMSGQYNVTMRNAVINGENQAHRMNRSQSNYEQRWNGTPNTSNTSNTNPNMSHPGPPNRLSHPDPANRSSFYTSHHQADSSRSGESSSKDYITQINKSLSRLGYNKEEKNQLPADTVPPPESFSTPKLNNHELYAEVETVQRISMEQQRKSNPIYEHINKYPAATQQHVTPRNHQNPQPHPNSANQNTPYMPSNNQPVYSGSSNYTPAYKYMPPPSRKSPRLPHKQIHPTGLELDDTPTNGSIAVTIVKNPGLGFSVAGGIGSQGNPYKPLDDGIFVTKVIPGGAAYGVLRPGDKIMNMNEHDFTHIEHNQAVQLLKLSPPHIHLTIQRNTPTDV